MTNTRLVPVEATEEMIGAGMRAAQLESVDKPFLWSDAVRAAYRGMLAAAPAALEPVHLDYPWSWMLWSTRRLRELNDVSEQLEEAEKHLAHLFASQEADHNGASPSSANETDQILRDDHIEAACRAHQDADPATGAGHTRMLTWDEIPECDHKALMRRQMRAAIAALKGQADD